MKAHYKSDLHRYNLTRITSNLRPLTQEEFDKKKAHFENLKKQDKKYQKQQILENSSADVKHTCMLCKKKFSTTNKLNEHFQSKSHLAAVKDKENNVVPEQRERRIKENTKTTLEDNNICIFCNEEQKSLKENFDHMKTVHSLDIPLESFLKNYESCIKLMATKVFTYKACIGCDAQSFENVYSLQNHMIDKKHIYVNLEDLEDHLYQFYDTEKLSAVKDNNIRLTKAFKILKYKLKLSKPQQTKKEESDEEEEFDDDEPMELPNGELLLQNGKILGNKLYNLYYKQRVHLNKFEDVMNTREFRLKQMKLRYLKRMQNKGLLSKRNFGSKVNNGTNNINRQNTLFKSRKQVNV